MSTEAITETILTDEDIATLNEARTILENLEKRCASLSWQTASGYIGASTANAGDYGSVRALADVAEHGIFRVLNWINSHYLMELSNSQLHNNKTIVDPNETT